MRRFRDLGDPRVEDFVAEHADVFGGNPKRVRQGDGEHLMTNCPWCGKEKHLGWNLATTQWKCLVCGETGNIQTMKERLGIRPLEAVRIGDAVGGGTRTRVRMDGPREKAPEPKASKPLLESDVEAWHQRLLAHADGDQPAQLAWDWLVETRRFTEAVVREFRLGVCEENCWGDDGVQAAAKEGLGVRRLSRKALLDGGGDEGGDVGQASAELHVTRGTGEGGRCEVCGGKQRMAFVTLPFYQDGKLVNVKKRTVPPWPKGWLRHAGGLSCLYHVDHLDLADADGQGVPPVILVEGEWDVIAMRVMGYRNVTTVPTGAQGKMQGDWLARLAPVELFYVCYDVDGTGQVGAERIAIELGRNRCSMVTLPAKDANDCLKDGLEDGVAAALEAAQDWRPDVIAPSEHWFEEIWTRLHNPEISFGMPTGWSNVDAIWGGCRPGEVTIITGHSKAGKTTWTQALGRNLAKQGFPGAIMPAETRPRFGVEQFLLMESGSLLRKPLSPETTRDEFDRCCAGVRAMPLWWINCHGRIPTDVLKETIYYLALQEGIRWTILDHIGWFVQAEDDESRWEAAERLIQDGLLKWADDLQLHIACVAHPKAIQGMDETTRIQMTHLKGGSGMWQDVHNILGVHKFRTKTRHDGKAQKEAPDGRCPASVTVLGGRSHYAKEGEALLDYDPLTCLYYDAV